MLIQSTVPFLKIPLPPLPRFAPTSMSASPHFPYLHLGHQGLYFLLPFNTLKQNLQTCASLS